MSAANHAVSCFMARMARIRRTSPLVGVTCLGERAQVRTRRQAIEEGVYGPVDERVKSMIGDVVVSAAGSTTIVDSRTQAEKAMHLPSVHGSLTYMESDIPCLIDVA